MFLIISLVQLVICKSFMEIPETETLESEDDYTEITVEELKEYKDYILSRNDTEIFTNRHVIHAPTIRLILAKLKCRSNQIYFNGSCRDLV